MMFCTSCDTQLREELRFCTGCGMVIGADSAPEVVSAEPSAVHQSKQEKEQIDSSNKFVRIFSSPKEKLVSVLGNNFAEKYLATGALESGFGVLSDKRFYFKGEAYFREGDRFKKRIEERIVDVKDISGTGFTHTSEISYIIGGAIGMFAAILGFAALPTPRTGVMNALTAFCLIGGIVAVGAYYASRKTLFEISFAGGGIAFDTNLMGVEEPRDFQRNIRLVKDAYEEQMLNRQRQASPTPAQQSVQEQPSGSVADELKKYKDLLDSGVITQDEFQETKNKLLGNL